MRIRFKAVAAMLILAGALSSAAFAAFAAERALTLSRARSSITFEVSAGDAGGGGAFNDFSGSLLLDPEDITRSTLSFQVNTANVAFDSMPLPNLLMLQGLVQTIRDPLVKFRSEKIERLGARAVRITGVGETARNRGQVSFKAKLDGCRLSGCRLYGVLSAGDLSALKSGLAPNLAGFLSGTAHFDLRFEERRR